MQIVPNAFHAMAIDGLLPWPSPPADLIGHQFGPFAGAEVGANQCPVDKISSRPYFRARGPVALFFLV